MVMVIIGMTMYLEQARWGAWDLPAALVPYDYVESVKRAGAEVLLIPPGDSANVLDRVDGLVLIGGADIDARLYDAEPHQTADHPRESRDATEMALYRRARELDMPILGICRGMQLMAVAHGGSLIQDLPDVAHTTLHREVPGKFIDHEATFVPGTLGASIFGTAPISVNSAHHQGVDDPGDLVVAARASDGIIEACEDPSTRFCLGVQWHPEQPDRSDVDAPLIAAFMRAATEYAAAKAE